MNEINERLGRIIGRLDNISSILNLPIPEDTNMVLLKSVLAESVRDLKDIFIDINNEDAWSK